MKVSFVKKLIFIGLFLYVPCQTMAWGTLGHRILGEIADSYLNAKARVEIKKILGNESIAMSANWADFIKSDTAYNYLTTWHYVDFGRNQSYGQIQAALKADTTTDAYTRLNFLTSQLKLKSLTKAKKLLYLRLLIHITGDIHQPYHVGYLDDQGGNAIKVSYFGISTNMHSIWDSRMIEDQQLSYTEYAMYLNHTTLAQRNAWIKGGLNSWIYDSYKTTESLYLDVKKDDKLSYKYIYDHIGTVNTQLLKGGVRLASLLNEIFGAA